MRSNFKILFVSLVNGSFNGSFNSSVNSLVTWLLISLVASSISLLLSCQIETKHNIEAIDKSQNNESLSQSYDSLTPKEKLKSNFKSDSRFSLSSDRSEFEALRKDIPQEVQVRNNEKAIYLEWMSEHRLNPSEVRSRFNGLISKKRDKFSQDLGKIREEYSKIEEANKLKFTKNIDSQRAEIKTQDLSKVERDEAFAKIETLRKDFYVKIRQDRDDFESDYRNRRKDFEEYIKDKSDSFNQDLKEYTEKYNEIQKSKLKQQ